MRYLPEFLAKWNDGNYSQIKGTKNKFSSGFNEQFALLCDLEVILSLVGIPEFLSELAY